MRALFTASIAILFLFTAFTAASAQDGAAEPLATENGQPVQEPGPVISYESATLPKDSSAAWQMLKAANGLHGDNLEPWQLLAQYRTYDAYGHYKGTGTFEYIWEGRDSWHVTYTEGSTVWTRWKTAKGIYAPPRQSDSPGYPESLIIGQLRNPLSGVGAPKVVPDFYADEAFSSMTLSCFRNLPIVESSVRNAKGPLQRFCSVQKRPVLRYAQSNYQGFYNKIAVFQHRIVAQQITLRDGNDPVLDVDVTALKSPDENEVKLIDPPVNAVLIRDTTLFLPPDVVQGRGIRKPAPKYPSEMKQERVQGTVRLAVLIGTDGRVTISDVLHSPAPALTKSSEEAVQQWTYEPYMKNGEPTEFKSVINITYALGR